MKNNISEHKKGVKAIKYSKKPKPLVGPEAIKKKAKTPPPKTEIEKHTNLAAKLESLFDSKPKGYDSDGNPLGGGYDEYDPSEKSWTVVVDGKAWKTFDNERQAYKAADSIKRKRGKSAKVVSENMFKEGSVQDKLYKRHQELRKKRGAPDPEYYKEFGKSYDIEDDQERYARQAEIKKKYGVKEAKRPDRPLPQTDLKVGDDVVADTSKEDYPGGHKERRGKITRVGQKGVHIKTDDSNEPEWHPYKIVKKSEKSMKEAKQPEIPKPRNFVAKNAKTAGAGTHKDAKKASKEVRGQKHKNKEMAESGLQYSIGVDKHGKDYMEKAAKLMRAGGSQEELGRLRDKESKAYKNKKESVAETYDQARAARIRYVLMLEENDWDQQSDEMIPPQYDMDPAELKAIRNAEFSEQDKIQAMIKLAAGGTSDADIAKIYDMDKETVASILDDYIEDIEAEMEPDDDVKEAEMGKVIDYKPGQTATINTGPGMTTILDLKKNPTSLTKDPASGKLKLVSTPQTTSQPSATAQSTVKAGDPVEIGKVESIQDILKLSGLK